MSPEASYTLPGGWLDRRGGCQRQGVLRPLHGVDEEWLYTLPPHVPQASVLVSLLARCVKRIGPYKVSRRMIRALPIADGDYLALRLHQLTFGDRVERVLACPSPTCGARMDVDFDLGQLPVEARPQQPRYVVRLDGPEAREVGFRLPHLGDVEEAGLTEDPERALLSRCILDIDGQASDVERVVVTLSAESLERIDAAMERASPRVEGTIEATCPECGQPFSTGFDAGASLLAELSQRRRDFDRSVHLLSLHYHWPLGEILGMPRERRRHWVRLLSAELDMAAGVTSLE
ncbi:hypothetical protein LY474_34075 [Myxococcus stipitatus]|uniref:T4 family baseplate hub assembly chaperone n=1 Tax=Myxococcus stipitatus TaxID=83455 RepID=UPI001F426285|nr:hypothetical protein [Myxococcus stipitatus]MCE9672846.1 hypothetical protein [Myxococcus stipitatus]